MVYHHIAHDKHTGRMRFERIEKRAFHYARLFAVRKSKSL